MKKFNGFNDNKDVLLIAHFCSDFDGNGNNRFNYLAELFSNHSINVELVTSDFSHNKKDKRDTTDLKEINYNISFIEEPMYIKNISLKRFYSHAIMAKNLKKYLYLRKKPDVIYCSVPSLDVAFTVAKFAKKNNIKFIIDIQDLWPEAFKMVFNVPIISNIIFYPMKKKANYIYASADNIISVSETYLKRALKVNTKVNKGDVIYLGTDLSKFDEILKENYYRNKPNNEIWIAYVGTLGHSYDLTSVFDALYILKKEGYTSIKFIVMGDGPLKKKFMDYAKSKEIYCEFTGRLPYNEMVGLLAVCDIAVNPISKGAAQSIINKHGDYAAASLPVLNTQECSEYRDLVAEYHMGINCKNNDSKDLAEKFKILLNDKKLRKRMGENSRLLAEERFDRRKTYLQIMEII